MSAGNQIRILLVEDYKTMLRILRNLLNQLGFTQVDEANNGAEAMLKLRQSAYDLVIADWNMEPISGLELLREVRGDAALQRLPFIMITADSKSERVVTARQAGVSDYIVKPFNTETLRVKISDALGA